MTCDPWPVVWPCDTSEVASDQLDTALAAATTILDGLSGQQFGTCTVKLRPCRAECRDGASWELGWPVWPDYWTTWGTVGVDAWLALATCGSCGGGGCSCTFVPELLLPAPVVRVTEVRVDGAVLVTGAYRLDDGHRLVRLDGSDWPCCNDLLRTDAQTGTWSVTAVFGQEVPAIGQLAVGELACDLLRALRGEDCRLPRGITQLARQGVTITIPDVTDRLNDGLTGLYTTDLFIRTVNPGRVAARARTYSVDRAPTRVTG